MSLRYRVWSPYIPLMVDEGFLCRTCKRKLPEDRWVKESMGQCADCWEAHPEPLPLYRDLNVVKSILEEDKNSGGPTETS